MADIKDLKHSYREQIKKQLDEQYKVLAEYEQEISTTSDPRFQKKYEYERDRIKQSIERLEITLEKIEPINAIEPQEPVSNPIIIRRMQIEEELEELYQKRLDYEGSLSLESVVLSTTLELELEETLRKIEKLEAELDGILTLTIKRDSTVYINNTQSYRVLSKPATNPYEGASGLPVQPPNFVGRDRVLKQIQDLWKNKAQLPPIILFGHRRMGKTSILQNLKNAGNSNDILVQADMQSAGLVDNSAEFFLKIVEEIELEAKKAGLDTGQFVSEHNFDSTAKATSNLDKLLNLLDKQLNGRRVIVAIDEFELIQKRIEQGRIDPDVLLYLRGINYKYKWLGLVFAGLHELAEMNSDYFGPFFGSAKHIRISYLEPEDAHELITQAGNPDFELKYDDDLVDYIYTLTYGQPYLIQMLCSELVEQWNERWRAEKGQIEPRLTRFQLEAALTERFFDEADYYFRGAWTQVGEKEHKLMLAVADWGEQSQKNPAVTTAIPKEQLRKTVRCSPKTFEIVLQNLYRRDLMEERRNHVSYFSEIMRRWVVRYQLQHKVAAS